MIRLPWRSAHAGGSGAGAGAGAAGEEAPGAAETREMEAYYVASQWQLIWRKFRRHRLAITGGCVLAVLYFVAIFAEFVAPYPAGLRFQEWPHHPPSRLHFVDEDGRFGLQPFVYGVSKERDPETLEMIYTEDKSARYPVRLFVRGEPYRLLGVIPSDIHLFGAEGEEPPQDIKDIWEVAEAWRLEKRGTERYQQLSNELIRRNVEGQYFVGLVSMPPTVVILNNRVANMERDKGVFASLPPLMPFMPDTWFLIPESAQ